MCQNSIIAVVLLSLLPLSQRSLPDGGEARRFVSSPSRQVSHSHVTRPCGRVTCSGPSVSTGCPVRKAELRCRLWELADGSAQLLGIHVWRDDVSHLLQPQTQDFALMSTYVNWGPSSTYIGARVRITMKWVETWKPGEPCPFPLCEHGCSTAPWSARILTRHRLFFLFPLKFRDSMLCQGHP